MFKRFKISGNSLYPSFKDGQSIFSIKLYKYSSLSINTTVVFRKEPYGLMVKKITNIQENRYYLKGTSIDSIDSRDFGYIEREALLYKVIF